MLQQFEITQLTAERVNFKIPFETIEKIRTIEKISRKEAEARNNKLILDAIGKKIITVRKITTLTGLSYRVINLWLTKNNVVKHGTKNPHSWSLN